MVALEMVLKHAKTQWLRMQAGIAHFIASDLSVSITR